jgi:transcriptional regulator with GAF, ATPase, and Fis domain
LLLVWSATQPACALLPLAAEPLDIGRKQGVLAEYPDTTMSRHHAQVAYRNGGFEVTDLGSRNGSMLDGMPLHGTARVPARTLVRLGQSLFLCCEDLRPFRQFNVKVSNQRVEGPALQQALLTVSQIGQSSRTLFISGESGTGKESVAKAFHRSSPEREGPFVAVNCAAIPVGVAERLLFGARKGAFSGAASDSAGYIEAAHNGTLFLDEVADLDLEVQGKLLRVIESGELLPLGATQPRKVKFRVCSATHKELRVLIEESRFRADLYFRIGLPQVSLPPLRERKEEIPWFLRKAVQEVSPDLSIDVSLAETCLLREWPGNIRELQAEISTAAMAARAAEKTKVGAEHLRPGAGAAILRKLSSSLPLPLPAAEAAAVPSATPSSVSRPAEPPDAEPPLEDDEDPADLSPSAETPSRAQMLVALIESNGNVSAAARAVRVHRAMFRRLLARFQIDVKKLRDVGKI